MHLFQILQAVVLHAKKLKKAIYVFSSSRPGSEDGAEGKVLHVNHVPDVFRSKGVDGRTWASKVSDIIGGKVHPGPDIRAICFETHQLLV